MNSVRTTVNVVFVVLSLVLTYFISLLGKGNGFYYAAAVFVILLFIGKIKFFPLTEHHMIPSLITITIYFVLFLIFAKLDVNYSTIIFLIEAFFACVWLTSWAYIKNKYSPIVLGYFETENSKSLTNTKKFNFVKLNADSDQETPLDGILYDEIVKHDDKVRLYISERGIKNIPVIELSSILQKTSGTISMDHIALCSFSDFSISPIYSIIKRLLDIFIVIAVSPILIILMLLTALGVLIDSRGPVIFTQQRTGKGDIPFTMYKFRSMIVESEKDGAKFATKNDVRITKFGKFIRKFRLDELPQFINIIKGEMSLIGPRPEQTVFTEQFNKQIPFYPYRHAVRPGITGWAQVSQGYAATVEQTEQKVEYDLFYIKNFSIWLDFLIVSKTIKTILTGFGAR